MKKQGLVVLSFLCVVAAAGVSQARADRIEDVLTVNNDAHPEMVFTFSVTTNDQGDLTGIAYATNHENVHSFSLGQVKKGVILMHDDSHNLNVFSVSAEESLTAKNGGSFHLIYLVNGITHRYQYFVLDVVRSGSRWLAYTSKDRGAVAFSEVILRANRFLGQIIGIKRIDIR
ncbi:hypothetical protein WDW37_14825 [Bdellovibrionota bacterium FG-1]